MSLSIATKIKNKIISFPPSLEPPGSPLPGGSLFMPCQKCVGGQVLPDWGNFKCLQCSAEHTSSGLLIKPRLGCRPKYDYGGKRFNRKFY